MHAATNPAAVSAPSAAVPLWRSEPFRILFPLGALLSWAGVLHWLLLATHLTESYRAAFHATAQIEGFMACYAAGFLMTLIPKRTRTAPAATWQVALATVCPAATVALAWFGERAAAQVPWLVFLAVLTGFALERFLAAGARRRVPNSFVWVVFGLVMAIAGTALTGAGELAHRVWIHDAGRGMVLQGVFSAFVLGLAPLLVPQITRGEVAGDAVGRQAVRAKLAHALGAAVFFGSFWIEAWHRPLGLGLRAAVAVGVLVFSARAWQRPTLPGLHRRLVWLAVWLLPAGFALAAAEPDWLTAALHVAFIGTFALLALAISIHVSGMHAGDAAALAKRPPVVGAMAALLLAALVFRVLVGADHLRFYLWLGLASGCFLAATVCWGFFVLPRLARTPL